MTSQNSSDSSELQPDGRDRSGIPQNDDLDFGLAAAFEGAGDWRSGPPSSVLDSFDSTAATLSRLCLRSAHDAEPEPVSRVRSDELPTESTGRYQIHGELNRGGMGAVLRGRDSDLGRDLAVKVLLREHMKRPALLERFVEEAQIGGQLQHPGIVPVHELGRFADGRPYFTMKLVRGQTLESLLAARGTLEEDRARFLGVFEQICQTVAYAHACGVVHRDLKPANIMVGSFGEVQVMDWGLAKVLVGGESDDADERPTREDVPTVHTTRSGGASAGSLSENGGGATAAGSVLGTPAYMAPEQARGEVQLIDERADVFGLGGILAEILTGEPPFAGVSAEAHRKARAGDLSEAYSRFEACGADAVLIELAKRCLAPVPSDRPRTGGDAADAMSRHLRSVEQRLREAQIERAAEKARAHEAQGRATAERRARRRTVALAATVLLAVLIGGAAWLRHESAESARLARLSSEIHTAVGSAVAEREKARRAGSDDLSAWNAARSEAERARAMAAGEKIDADLRTRVVSLVEEIETEERDRRLLSGIDEALFAMGEMHPYENRFSSRGASNLFRSAFETWGMRPGQESVDQAAKGLQAVPESVRSEILGAIDLWSCSCESTEERGVREIEAVWLRKLVSLVETDPWRTAFLAARTEIDTDRRKEGFEMLARSPAVLDQPDSALVHLVQESMQKGATVDSAIDTLRTLWRRDPGRFLTNSTLGLLIAHNRDRAEGLQYLRAAVAIRPRSAGAHLNLGVELEKVGRFDEAAKALERALELRPGYAAAHFNLGLVFDSQRNDQKAVENYRRAIDRNPSYAKAYFGLGLIFERQGDHDKAIESYQRAIDLAPKYGAVYSNLGRVLSRQGEHDKAIESFETAIKIDPKRAAAHIALGNLFERLGELQKAEKCFREAIDLDPKNAIAHYNLGQVFANRGDREKAAGNEDASVESYKAALQNYQTATRIDPNYEKAYANAGDIFLRLGNAEEAKRCLQTAIDLDPNDLIAHFNLGYVFERQGEYKSAIENYKRAVAIDAKDVESLKHLGLCHSRSGQREDAAKVFRKLIEVQPNFPRAHFLLASTLAAEGRFSDSLDAYRAGHEIGSRQANWNYPSAAWVERAERLTALEKKVDAILSGDEEPETANEILDYAQICYAKKRFADATELYREAFQRKSELARQFRRHRCYNAACSAALAAAGRGVDAAELDEVRRAQLRGEALRWLQADLESWRSLGQSAEPESIRAMSAALAHWLRDPDLASVRDEEALAELPESESSVWRAFWSDLESLLSEVKKGSAD